MRVGVPRLGGEAVGDPDLRPGAGEEVGDDRLGPSGHDAMVDGGGRGEHPLPAGAALDAGRGLVAGDHGGGAHGCLDDGARDRERLGRAGQHVGDGAFRDVQAEQPVEHLDEAVVADQLAGVQVDDEGDDAWSERTAERHIDRRRGGHPRVAAGAVAAVQMDARRDRLDRRQVDVVVGVNVGLIGRRQRGSAARAGLGVDLTDRVGIGAQRPGRAGPTLATRLGFVGPIDLLAGGRRHRGVAGRLRRDLQAGLQLGDTGPEGAVLLDELHDQRLERVRVERINCLWRHPALGSAGPPPINIGPLSRIAAPEASQGVSNYGQIYI